MKPPLLLDYRVELPTPAVGRHTASSKPTDRPANAHLPGVAVAACYQFQNCTCGGTAILIEAGRYEGLPHGFAWLRQGWLLFAKTRNKRAISSVGCPMLLSLVLHFDCTDGSAIIFLEHGKLTRPANMVRTVSCTGPNGKKRSERYVDPNSQMVLTSKQIRTAKQLQTVSDTDI